MQMSIHRDLCFIAINNQVEIIEDGDNKQEKAKG